jgi:hypothetical protein
LPALLLVASWIFIPGCAFRTATAEYYLGPTVLRVRDACREATQVSEVIQSGVVGEAGTQWGLALGFTDRVAAVAVDGGGDACGQSGAASRWSSPFTIPGELLPGRWRFSPLYVRSERRSGPRFVRRLLWGAQITAGPDANALSVGAVAGTLWMLPDDAVCVLQYDDRDPMATRFSVRSVKPGEALPALEEEGR